MHREVSLGSAYRTYTLRASDSLKDLCEAIVQAWTKDRYNITHLYAFKANNGKAQLFYCSDGDRGDLFTSQYVKEPVVVWESGRSLEAPQYLKRDYAEFLREEGVPEQRIAALGLE